MRVKVPKTGTKIRFTKPIKWHWFKNVTDDQKLLTLNGEYTVKKVEVASSSTYVWLEEMETYDEERNLPFFNLHSFEWDEDQSV